MPRFEIRLLLVSAALLLWAPATATALLVGGFGPHGEGGVENGFLFALGSGGQVHELDAFVALGGQDLNGGDVGVAAQLSVDALPPPLAYAFSAVLFGNGGILLSYQLENVSAVSLPDLVFLSFLDAEVVEASNTFFNETAEVSGALAPGQGFEVDEPGFVGGNLFDHLLAGDLDDTNALPPGSADDVAMALSFAFESLQPGQIARIDVLVSEAGDALSGVVLTQRDPDNETTITYSGTATTVPEPGTAELLGAGLLLLAAHRRDARRCV